MKDKDSSHYGWVVVGISFVTLALAYGVWYSFSVFFVALLKEYSWSRSIAAGAFSLCIIIHSLVGPFVGGMVDRLGPRKVILIGSSFLGIGLALCSFTQTWWQFYIFFGVITAVGIGAVGWVPNVTLIQHWFKANRGLAIGIISSGIGVGILICVPFIQYLITHVGWRGAYRIMAVFIPLIVISMGMAVLKPPPQRSRIRQTELTTPHPVIKDPLIVNEEWAAKSWTIQQVLSTQQFWLVGLSFLLGSFVTQTIFAHHVAFFVDHGLEDLFASYMVGIVGIVSVGSKILWGGLSDKIGRELTYSMGSACSICGIVFLILFSMFHSSSLPYLYAFFFGAGYAVWAALPPLVAADFFEGKAYGSIFGALMFLSGFGGAFGTWFAGFVHDQVGTYIPVFIIVMGCAFFSCLVVWWVAPRKFRTVPGKKMEQKNWPTKKGEKGVSKNRD